MENTTMNDEIVNASGTVTNVEGRQVKTRYGDKMTYNVYLSDGTKFDTSFKTPASLGIGPVGSTCEVVLTNTKYGLKFKETGNAQGAAPAASVPATSRPTGAAGRPFPVPKNSGELAIIRQNALTNAVSWYNANVVPEENVDDEVTAERIIAMAYRFAEFSSGHREVAAVEQMTNAEASSK
jgi:hypothetical protein